MGWLSQLCGENEMEYIEVSKKYLMKLEENSKELEVYKKAYNMLAEAYCDKGECSKCYCKNSCIEFNGIKNGYTITKDFFLHKARVKNDSNT